MITLEDCSRLYENLLSVFEATVTETGRLAQAGPIRTCIELGLRGFQFTSGTRGTPKQVPIFKDFATNDLFGDVEAGMAFANFAYGALIGLRTVGQIQDADVEVGIGYLPTFLWDNYTDIELDYISAAPASWDTPRLLDESLDAFGWAVNGSKATPAHLRDVHLAQLGFMFARADETAWSGKHELILDSLQQTYDNGGDHGSDDRNAGYSFFSFVAGCLLGKVEIGELNAPEMSFGIRDCSAYCRRNKKDISSIYAGSE